MPDLLKEKYNVFKGLVGLFDTKTKAAVIVTLIIVNVYQYYSRQESDARYLSMIIEEVHRQVPKATAEATAPIRDQVNKTSEITRRTAAKIDTLASNTNEVLDNIGQKINKSKN